jgi:hypothetical protein
MTCRRNARQRFGHGVLAFDVRETEWIPRVTVARVDLLEQELW